MALSTLQLAWDQAEVPLLRMLLKVCFTASMFAAAPFFAAAFLFVLLAKPLVWIAVPAVLGAVLVGGGLGVFLYARSRLRRLRRHLDTFAAYV